MVASHAAYITQSTGPQIYDIPAIVEYARGVKYCTVASAWWLVYDWALSLSDEIELVWKSPNTPPKFLYLFSRYFGCFTQLALSSEALFPYSCRRRLVFQAIAYHLLNYSIELGLMIRVYAMWGKSRRVGYALIFGFILSEVGNLCLLAYGFRDLFLSTHWYPKSWPIRGCYSAEFPSFYRFLWFPIVAFETLLFILSVVRCYSFRPLSDTPTIVRICRDGTVYYFIMLLYLSIDMGMGFVPYSGGLMQFFDPFVPALFSYAGSHLLLSIRMSASENKNQSFLDLGASPYNIPSFVDTNSDHHIPPLTKSMAHLPLQTSSDDEGGRLSNSTDEEAWGAQARSRSPGDLRAPLTASKHPSPSSADDEPRSQQSISYPPRPYARAADGALRRSDSTSHSLEWLKDYIAGHSELRDEP